jgi:hypothetical protein
MTGRALHDVGLSGFHGQGQGGDAIGDQVHPQNLQRREGHPPQPHQRGGSNGQHFADVATEDVFDEAADVVVHHPAFFGGADDGGEVVV